VKKLGIAALRLIAATAIAAVLFRDFQRAAILCAASFRKRWPEAWFSGSIVAFADFLLLFLCITAAVLIVCYALKRRLSSN